MNAGRDSPVELPRVQTTRREAGITAIGVTLATMAVITFAFDPDRAGDPLILVSIGSLYAILTVAALWRFHRRGELRRQMRPLGGDLTFGAAMAALLYGVATAAHLAITSHGSAREGWIMRIYLQVGDPADQNRHLLGGFVFLIAAMEEIVWRGLVMRSLEGPFGTGRAWIAAAVLFAMAHGPTCLLLRDPTGGYNPMLVGAALGCGAVWGYLAGRVGRLAPAIFCHAFFSWSVLEFPIWRP